MPLMSFQSVLRIIQTVLNILVAALSALSGIDTSSPDDNDDVKKEG